ncbi:hypothetical protein B5E82_07955 [Lachnoclostridium sp. An138]|nr:hypothetical protein B5E82_07955 [Lachnoclostridium sp. An138]
MISSPFFFFHPAAVRRLCHQIAWNLTMGNIALSPEASPGTLSFYFNTFSQEIKLIFSFFNTFYHNYNILCQII